MEDLRNCIILWLLLLLSALRPALCGDPAVRLNVRGRIGESVQLPCNVSNSPQVKGIYFQKTNSSGEDIFVNGFYVDRAVGSQIPPQYKSRTSINNTFSISMTIRNLTASDEGEYKCVLIPDGKDITRFHLKITAPYSVPTITVKHCGDHGDGTESWVVRCWSSDGYPPANLTWAMLDGGANVSLLEGVTETSSDEQSGVWTIAQTATLNCTHPAKVTCSVGGTASPSLNICTSKVTPLPPPENKVIVIIAGVVIFIFLFSFVFITTRLTVCQRSQQAEAQLNTVEVQMLNHSPLLDQAG